MRTLPIGGGVQDQALEMFRVPATLDELDSQPVKKKGMTREFAPNAEILGGLHQAETEDPLPVTIYGDAGRQGMLGTGEPLSEAQSVSWPICIPAAEGLRSGRS